MTMMSMIMKCIIWFHWCVYIYIVDDGDDDDGDDGDGDDDVEDDPRGSRHHPIAARFCLSPGLAEGLTRMEFPFLISAG